MTQTSYALNLRHLLIASAVPLAFLIAATLFKPFWRDEYWSIFYSSDELTLKELATEVHPPFYYMVLNQWRNLFESDIGMRLLSLPICAVFGGLVWQILNDKREAAVFLLLSLGSYWVIYFSAELRPYLLMYGLTAVSVALAVYFVERCTTIIPVAGFAAVGMLLSLTHYFGALWFAMLSASLGLYFLIAERRTGLFITIGVLSALSLLPCIAWILLTLQSFDMTTQVSDRSFLDEIEYAANQFVRGISAKLIGSNPLAAIAGFVGLYAAFKFRERVQGILLWSVIGTVLIAFVLHFTFVTMIKERAFVAIMPALLFLISRNLATLPKGQGWPSSFAKYTPMAAAIMPFLFIPEYFKDREKLGEVQAILQQHSVECAGEPILVYNRPSHNYRYGNLVNQRVLRLNSGTPEFVEVSPNTSLAVSTSTNCPVKAAALVLEKGGGESYEAALEAFRRGGLDVDQLTQRTYGNRRNLLLVDQAFAPSEE